MDSQLDVRQAGARLSAKARKAIPTKSFALPGRRYPIEDASHARNALARVSQHGSSEEKAKVRAAVHRRYPNIGQQAGARAEQWGQAMPQGIPNVAPLGPQQNQLPNPQGAGMQQGMGGINPQLLQQILQQRFPGGLPPGPSPMMQGQAGARAPQVGDWSDAMQGASFSPNLQAFGQGASLFTGQPMPQRPGMGPGMQPQLAGPGGGISSVQQPSFLQRLLRPSPSGVGGLPGEASPQMGARGPFPKHGVQHAVPGQQWGARMGYEGHEGPYEVPPHPRQVVPPPSPYSSTPMSIHNMGPSMDANGMRPSRSPRDLRGYANYEMPSHPGWGQAGARGNVGWSMGTDGDAPESSMNSMGHGGQGIRHGNGDAQAAIQRLIAQHEARKPPRGHGQPMRGAPELQRNGATDRLQGGARMPGNPAVGSPGVEAARAAGGGMGMPGHHMHALTMASAKHLRNAGHISPAQHQQIHAHAANALAAMRAPKAGPQMGMPGGMPPGGPGGLAGALGGMAGGGGPAPLSIAPPGNGGPPGGGPPPEMM